MLRRRMCALPDDEACMIDRQLHTSAFVAAAAFS